MTAPGPYWAGDGVVLYLGDCREITEWLAADVLVTDPPYGRNWKQGGLDGPRRPGNANRRHGGGSAREGIAGDKDTTVRDSALTLWGDRKAIAFGDLMLPPPAGTRQVLVYRKPPDSGARGTTAGFRRDVEAVYLIGPWPSGIAGRSSVLATAARAAGGVTGVAGRHGHPHAKPDDVMEILIAACPAGTIADPFAGSGSTLIAARNQGRPAIGVEIDEYSCEQAAKRLSQADMFSEVSA